MLPSEKLNYHESMNNITHGQTKQMHTLPYMDHRTNIKYNTLLVAITVVKIVLDILVTTPIPIAYSQQVRLSLSKSHLLLPHLVRRFAV